MNSSIVLFAFILFCCIQAESQDSTFFKIAPFKQSFITDYGAINDAQSRKNLSIYTYHLRYYNFYSSDSSLYSICSGIVQKISYVNGGCMLIVKSNSDYVTYYFDGHAKINTGMVLEFGDLLGVVQFQEKNLFMAAVEFNCSLKKCERCFLVHLEDNRGKPR